MADLTRFFPGLGLGVTSAGSETKDPASGVPAVLEQPPVASAPPPLLSPSQVLQQAPGASGGAPPAPSSGLMNPFSVLTGGAAAPTGASAPSAAIAPVATDGGALLAMLQKIPGMPDSAGPAKAGDPAQPAAAVQSAPRVAPKQQNGITLSRGTASHEVGKAELSSSRKQTQVTHIAAYKFPPGYRNGRLVAVSPKYICYGVRGGSIRVRHQSTAMQLLKGHTTSELADITITGEGDECTLATATESGDLFVWSIRIVDVTSVAATELYRLEGGAGISRVLWHPTDAVLLCAGAGKAEGEGDAPEFVVRAGQGFAEGAEPSWGVRATHKGLVTSIAWVPETDGVVSAGVDGTVVVSDASGNAIASWQPYEGRPVQSALVAHPKGRDKPLVITGSEFNRAVKLWSFTGSHCYHTLELNASAPEAFKAAAVMDPEAELLFLANSFGAGPGGKVLLTVHLNVDGPEPFFDTLCEFDVMYTILSCTASQHSFEPHVDQSTRETHLYAAQSEVLQQYHIPYDSCRNHTDPADTPEPALPTPAPVPTPAPAPAAPTAPSASSVPPPSLPAAILPSSPLPAPPSAVDTVSSLPSTVEASPPPTEEALSEPPAPAPAAAPAAVAPSPAPVAQAAGVGAEELSALEGRLLSRLEAVVQQSTAALAERLEAQARQREERAREETRAAVDAAVARLAASLEDKVSRSAAEAVQGVLPREIGAAIKTHIPAALEANARSPQALETTKAAMEKVVAPVVDKAVKAMGDKTVAAVKPALQESFRASFQGSIIPAFESSCQKMFEQIQATFERGIEEKAQQEQAAAAAATQMQHLQTVAESLTAKLQELEAKTAQAAATSAAAASGGGQGQGQGQGEQRSEQQAAQAAALAQNIRGLLQQERYEEAFAHVLSLSDLKLVVWCCHLVDSRQIFGKATKVLSSPVVLSLVQQLGFDLRQDAQLKVTWLRDAVMSLDPKDPVVGSHVPVILRDLHEKLTVQTAERALMRRMLFAAMERSPAEHPVTAENDFRLLMHVLKSIISS